MPSRNINLIALPFTSTLPLLCFVLLSKKWLPRRQGFQAARNCPTYEYGELKSVDENMVNSSPRNSKPSIE
ncbi:hypothetical protein BDE02_02G088300 [Populus trichocarpa]|nr:hypothetical protein BDE02_02G088300 [Populus trichocarpa]